ERKALLVARLGAGEVGLFADTELWGELGLAGGGALGGDLFLALLGVELDEDFGHFAPGELLGGHDAVAEHLADLGAREDDDVLGVGVGAGLEAGHAFEAVTVEAVLEAERLDADLFGFEAVEDLLRVIGT